MDVAALDRVLHELRTFRADHQTVEAKRARDKLPENVLDSVIAFANAEGGLLLLGVHENDGAFDVTGVEEPGAVMAALQSAGLELEPVVRPRISPIEYASGVTVLVAEIEPVPRRDRPCHRRADGPVRGSFIRVGDADQPLTDSEVAEMQAEHQGTDHSARPAPEGAELDQDLVGAFVARVRADSARAPDDDDELLRRWRLVDDGHPTVAGMLTMGVEPAARSQMARVAYRVDPPAGSSARFSADHLDGTVGELLDLAVQRLTHDLNPRQVFRDGGLYDEPDFPVEALREVISNALTHRSMTAAMDDRPVSIRVYETVVVISSPGGLHVGGDLAQLGLTPFSGVRNLTLVRACQKLRTPSGARIVESQASGIPAADDACRDANAMPVLFVDKPAQFDAVCVRGILDQDEAERLLRGTALEADDNASRIVAVAVGLRALGEQTPWSGAARTRLDARFAARVLAHETAPEDAAVLLASLQQAGVLVPRGSRSSKFWSLPARPDHEQPMVQTPTPDVARSGVAKPAPATPAGRRQYPDRVDDLLLAIADANGALQSRELGVALGLTSSRSINRWINRALEKNLIEPNTDEDHDPTRAYLLTSTGKAHVRRLRARKSA